MAINNPEDEISLPGLPPAPYKLLIFKWNETLWGEQTKHCSVYKLRKLYSKHVNQKQRVFSPNKSSEFIIKAVTPEG